MGFIINIPQLGGTALYKADLEMYIGKVLVSLDDSDFLVSKQYGGFPKSWGYPKKNMVLFHGKSHVKIADFGVPP